MSVSETSLRPAVSPCKTQTLRRSATLNPNPEKVSDPLFSASDFFDARDLVQVKYEMVRRVRVDGQAKREGGQGGGT